MATKKTAKKATKKGKLERILFIPDTHVPYHDKRAFALMLKAMKDFKPNHTIVMGDFLDNYSVSSHSKDPNRSLKLEEEVNETIHELKKVKALGAKNNVFIGGNHEDRLERYLMQKAPELYNIISTEKILKLDELGFEYVPYKHHYKIGKINVTHDTGTAGRTAHQKALDSFQDNILIGHTHRLAYIVEGDAKGTKHVSAMLGWLGDVEGIDYMNKYKVQKDWCLAFGIGYLDTATGNVYVVPVPIINYTCLVEGKLYKN